MDTRISVARLSGATALGLAATFFVVYYSQFYSPTVTRLGSEDSDVKIATLSAELGLVFPDSTRITQSDFLHGKDKTLWAELSFLVDDEKIIIDSLKEDYFTIQDLDRAIAYLQERPTFQLASEDIELALQSEDRSLVVICKSVGGEKRLFIQISSSPSGLNRQTYRAFGSRRNITPH